MSENKKLPEINCKTEMPPVKHSKREFEGMTINQVSQWCGKKNNSKKPDNKKIDDEIQFKQQYLGDWFHEEPRPIESYAITEIQYFHRQGKDYDYCIEHEVRRLESFTKRQTKRIEELNKERKLFAEQYEKSIIACSDALNKIESMKCCGNCKHQPTPGFLDEKCMSCFRKKQGNSDNWKIKTP